jgi:hypothetical protein
MAAEFLGSSGAVRRAYRQLQIGNIKYQVRVLRNNKGAYKLYLKKEMNCLWKAGLLM